MDDAVAVVAAAPERSANDAVAVVVAALRRRVIDAVVVASLRSGAVVAVGPCYGADDAVAVVALLSDAYDAVAVAAVAPGSGENGAVVESVSVGFLCVRGAMVVSVEFGAVVRVCCVDCVEVVVAGAGQECVVAVLGG